MIRSQIFSIDFDNIKGQHYICSTIGYKNVAYAGGKGEEEQRLVQQIGKVEGLNRREVFLDCSSAADIDELTTEGEKKLAELKKTQSFEAQILISGSFIFKKDYFLGEVVTVQNIKWGITMNSRITEIKEIWEVGGYQLEATFGTNIPNLISSLKREIKKVVR